MYGVFRLDKGLALVMSFDSKRRALTACEQLEVHEGGAYVVIDIGDDEEAGENARWLR